VLGEFDRRSGIEGGGGIVCCQQIVLGNLIECGKGRLCGNCVLTADCVRGI